MKYLALLFILVLLGTASCKKEEEGPTVMHNNPGATAIDTVARGVFTSYQHSLSGSALLYTDVNNATVLQLDNFNMTSGPDVHVFLSKTASYSAANILDLGQLTGGFTNSTLSYTLNGYDATYKYVLVYCVTYSALFGYTELINE